MEYKMQDRVEVMDPNKGFEGSYYEGVIVKNLEGGEYVVAYDNLLTEDLSGPLIEVVAAENIRPAPPQPEGPTRFRINQEVDVYYNDGWWAGRIVGKSGSVFHVYFGSSRDLLPMRIDQLRVHQDWVNGMWVIPPIGKGSA